MANHPVLEYADGSPPYELATPDTDFGDARLSVAGGGATIANMNPADPRGVLRNGRPVAGTERLVDGDRIEIAGVVVIFRAPRGAAPAPLAKPAAAEQSTMIAGEVPDAVKQLMAQKAKTGAAAPQQPAAQKPLPAGGSTMEMDVDKNVMRAAAARAPASPAAPPAAGRAPAPPAAPPAAARAPAPPAASRAPAPPAAPPAAARPPVEDDAGQRTAIDMQAPDFSAIAAAKAAGAPARPLVQTKLGISPLGRGEGAAPAKPAEPPRPVESKVAATAATMFDAQAPVLPPRPAATAKPAGPAAPARQPVAAPNPFDSIPPAANIGYDATQAAPSAMGPQAPNPFDSISPSAGITAPAGGPPAPTPWDSIPPSAGLSAPTAATAFHAPAPAAPIANAATAFMDAPQVPPKPAGPPATPAWGTPMTGPPSQPQQPGWGAPQQPQQPAWGAPAQPQQPAWGAVAPAGPAAGPAGTAILDAPQGYAAPSSGPMGGPASPPMGGPMGTPAWGAAAQMPYTPSGHSAANLDHGFVASITRAFGFIKQMFALASHNKTLLKPLFYDLVITTPASILLAIILIFVDSAAGVYGVLLLGTLFLYFTDYACNSLTASLIYDQVTTGRADVPSAMTRVKRSLGGIMVFASISAVLDVASTYARERNDVLSRILLNVLRAIWTTATYVIMPAMIIEGVSFGDAFKRSKQLMSQDPTGVGAGIVAMSIISYFVGFVMFPLAYFMFRAGAWLHPAFGAVLFFLMINLYWSVSGWLKISYSTCFYLWARECEANRTQDPALAPAPLRSALTS